MAKKLINKNLLQDLYCRETMTFTVAKGMIMSQSALDFAREYQIKITYNTEETAPTPAKADVKKVVADLLRKEYGIENEKILQAILNKLNQK